MLVLPWYLRFAFDVSCFVIPISLVYKYPSLLGHPFIDSRRIKRRFQFQKSTDILNENPTFTVQQVKDIYKQIGMTV